MRRAIAALSLVLLSSARPLPGQTAPHDVDTASAPAADWLVSASFGVPGFRSQPILELFTIGMQWTQFRPGRLGGDFSLGTMPRLLAEGALVLGFRGGTALPIAVTPNLVVVPSAGVSLIGGAGQGGGGGVAGLNGGLAVVLFGTGTTGLRTGITWHRFEDTRAAVWLVEMGVSGIPKGRGPRSPT
jgi:hypothetical protein